MPAEIREFGEQPAPGGVAAFHDFELHSGIDRLVGNVCRAVFAHHEMGKDRQNANVGVERI
ncbi:MAG: hypothetical protein A3G34_08550 [Candidatus Lindowbacteria bacterium RIFCSPLOWO2_12_FULL_62_27]|nr:MAG: hypothetical protein A3G34_08550 [Candidatus Lindowbacteria bacterium RIFCSPLOWO2_12_FULL_62_27]